MKNARVIMVASLLVFAAAKPAVAQQHQLPGTRLFEVGDRLDYDLTLTTAVQGIEQADCTGTVSRRAEAVEEVAGYNTADVAFDASPPLLHEDFAAADLCLWSIVDRRHSDILCH